jgi:enoyl-[acyl-carrier protein] reductase I
MGVAKAALESSVRYLALDLGKDNIRVNAVSAGAIMTRAGGAIQGMAELISLAAASSPLARETTQQEVGDAVAFLASDMASGISGQTIYVDCGYSSVGAPGLKP